MGLFNKDFSLIVIGQIISLMGNAVLRFTLPLYLLETTGSSTLFGSILAIAMIPTILLSPFGGMIADRVNKGNIMIILDLLTAVIMLVFGITLSDSPSVLTISIVLILLSVIQSFYQPTVQASIPVLLSEENILKGNAIVNQINGLSNLLGPILAGFLYGFLGLMSILIFSGISFFISAVIELFINIPFSPQEKESNIFKVVAHDFKLSKNFIINDKPIIFKIMLIIAAFNLFLTAMIIVGLPVIIKGKLGLSNQLYALSQSMLMIGTLIGGILVGLLSKKIHTNKFDILFLTITLALLPMGGMLVLDLNPILSYIIIVCSTVFIMVVGTMFNIMIMVFIQKETPSHIMAKVIALISTISMSALPLGQLMYGYLFDIMIDKAYLIVFVVVFVSMFITIASRRITNKIIIS
ncbi:MFS transporter [Tepidibacter aestuarii]|uniref:MFS transporter n=1 Tax=Tepidibacter aestuarii TaxID=2925782 RepID=UPI0020C0A52F|nr:MFS transporter [Tepidibacter aestuarii]